MDCQPDSFNLDSVDNHNYDPDELFNQQKEIDGILSKAFDDLSSISDESLSNEDYDNSNITHKSPLLNQINQKYCKDNLTHSTPIRSSNYYNNIPHQSRLNISNIDEEDINDGQVNSSSKSDVSFAAIEEMHNGVKFSNEFINNAHNKSGLHKDGILSKDLNQLKEKCSKINLNYYALQNNFEELHKVNGINLQTIQRLQSKVRFLENEVKEEKNQKDKMSKKVAILESTVESLEYQLDEIGKSNFISRTNDAHAQIIANLKQKQDKELNALRDEIENLTQNLLEKDEIISSKNGLIQRYEKEFSEDSSRLKQMVQITKEMLNKEMKEKMEQEIKYIKEKTEINLLNSFDQSINRLKEEWQQKLEEDISKIVDWIDNNINQNKGDIQIEHLPDLDIKFEPLTDICVSLKNSINDRECRIKLQVEKLNQAKCQLEDALLESKMSSSNISTNSDKSQLLDELKYELDQVKNESQTLALKLQKYKQHYHLLVKRHKNEVDSLKNEFIERLKNKSNFI